MIVIMIDSTIAGLKEPFIHSRVTTPSSPAGMLPIPRNTAISTLTERCLKCCKDPVSLVRVAKVRSVPTAVGAGTPTTATKKGVMMEPPPTPVRPTRKPTRRPKSAGPGSITPALRPVERLDRPEIAGLFEVADDPPRALLGVLLVGPYMQLRGSRHLVGVGDTGELRDLPRESLLVEALDVPLGTNLQRGIHEDLDEVLSDVAPYLVARLLKGRDDADDHTDPVARQEVGYEPDPEDVRVPVLPGKTEALAQVGPHNVPVQNLYLAKAVP